MVLDWKHVQGTQSDRPLEVDRESSPSCVYLRKNIVRATREDGQGAVDFWEYDEAVLTPVEYAEYEEIASVVDAVNETIGTTQILETLLGGTV